MAVSGGVRVEGLARLTRQLVDLGADLDDLKNVFAGIASEGAHLAASFAPKRSGALAASIRGNRAKNKAVVTAGRAAVPYAGAINYGWPARGIRPALFLQRADVALQPRALDMLESGINDAIAKRGLQ